MHYLVEKTFRQRGFDDELLNKIENGSHTIPDNMSLACSKLHEYMIHRYHIVLIPDFDMDGIASGSIGYSGFCELGFYFSLYLPDVTKGYGFGPEDIDNILQKWPDTKVIMTCDVGIGCTQAITYAKSLGLEVFVTDHHVGNFKNDADVVIDTSAYGSTYTNSLGVSKICGAYVIWQVLMAYANAYCTAEQINAVERLIIFAGIGTISDVMPMVCENRVAVKDSLRILRWLMPSDEIVDTYQTFDKYANSPLSGYHDLGTSHQYRNAFYGLQALMWYFKAEQHYDHYKIDEDFFGFMLAPMFNSVKRMGGDISVAFGVFFDKENCYTNIKELFDLNIMRKQAVADSMAAMNTIPQPFAPFLYLSDAPAGILGLLATQLLKSTGMPTLVVNRTPFEDGRLHGSGRSPENYNFMEAISRLKLQPSMISIAGHPTAFGVNVPANDDLLSALYMSLYTDTAADAAAAAAIDPFKTADFIIGTGDDCDVDFDVFTLDEYLHEIRRYKPFGHGFFRPNIAIRLTKEDMKSCPWFIMGRESQHVKYCQEDGLDIVIWDGAGDTYFCKDGFSALGHLQYIEYDGEQQLSFVVDNLLDTEVTYG